MGVYSGAAYYTTIVNIQGKLQVLELKTGATVEFYTGGGEGYF